MNRIHVTFASLAVFGVICLVAALTARRARNNAAGTANFRELHATMKVREGLVVLSLIAMAVLYMILEYAQAINNQ